MISEDCRQGLKSERANPYWPYPYAPRPDLRLPAVWRAIELTNREWLALAESTPRDMRAWEPSKTSWADVLGYWESRARTQEDVMRIVDTELFPKAEREGNLHHLCGRSNCPGGEAHAHPFFDKAPAPPDRHPGVVKDAGRQPYNTWAGDNMVYVAFDDGARALFPGTWLREKAQEGDRAMASLQEEHDRKRKSGWREEGDDLRRYCVRRLWGSSSALTW